MADGFLCDHALSACYENETMNAQLGAERYLMPADAFDADGLV